MKFSVKLNTWNIDKYWFFRNILPLAWVYDGYFWLSIHFAFNIFYCDLLQEKFLYQSVHNELAMSHKMQPQLRLSYQGHNYSSRELRVLYLSVDRFFFPSWVALWRGAEAFCDYQSCRKIVGRGRCFTASVRLRSLEIQIWTKETSCGEKARCWIRYDQ